MIKNCLKSFFLSVLNQRWWLQEASRNHKFFGVLNLTKQPIIIDASRSSLSRFARLLHVIYTYCPAHAIFISLMSSVRQQREMSKYQYLSLSLSIIFKTRISVKIVINVLKTSKSEVIDVRIISILRDKQIQQNLNYKWYNKSGKSWNHYVV